MWRFLTWLLGMSHGVLFCGIVGFPVLFPISWLFIKIPSWVLWFHVFCLLTITAEIITKWPCPITVLENYCRRKTKTPSYDGGFVNHWGERFLKRPVTDQDFNKGFTLIFVLSLLEYVGYVFFF
jgi:hypothetical protein